MARDCVIGPPSHSWAESSPRKYVIVIICHAVLCLPSFSAGRTWPFVLAKSRSPVIKNSRLMMMITTHASTNPSGIRQIKADAVRILSASGSINLPKSVTRLRLRAISPSR